MDSCNSAMAGIHPHGEILTASGWESTTPAAAASSFTRVLIDEIRSLNGRSFTASDLHSMIMTWAFSNNISATPIHKANVKCPSVLIHKVGTQEARKLARASLNNTAKVLITVSIEKCSVPDVDEWGEWLTAHMPPDFRDIEIVAHWTSSSSAVTLLVSVPVQVWTFLQDHPAYSFVSFVHGKVHHGLPPPPQPSASTVQQQGADLRKENIPPQSLPARPAGQPSSPFTAHLRPRTQLEDQQKQGRPGSSSGGRQRWDLGFYSSDFLFYLLKGGGGAELGDAVANIVKKSHNVSSHSKQDICA